MLLNDIGSAHTTTLKKINQHLESNYGFKITEDSKDKDLVVIMETIQDEINDLKIKGDDARSSPEISKRLLVLEGLKTLREFAVLQFQSPKLEPLISVLSNKLVAEFSKSGRGMSDFESELRTIMNTYRSSEFRFDDSYIEQRVKAAALSQLQSNDEIDDIAATTLAAPEQSLGEEITDEANVFAQHARAGENEWARDLASSSAQQTKAKPNNDEPDIPMIRDKHGRMVPDPFAAHAAARKKGIAMKENTNLVKHLRQLLETEVSQAEVMMAAKGFAQELQEMVEKIGRLQNEDLPPVTDQMRETYGMESASAFQTQIYGALQSVMDALYTAKGQVDDAVGNMASTGQVTASVDMDKDIDDMDGMGDDMSALDGSDDAAELDLDNIGDDLGAEDEFGSAEDEEPLGRSMKESAILRKKIAEMKKIVNKARKLRESSK